MCLCRYTLCLSTTGFDEFNRNSLGEANMERPFSSFGKKLIVFAGKRLIAAVRFVEVDESRLAAAAAWGCCFSAAPPLRRQHARNSRKN